MLGEIAFTNTGTLVAMTMAGPRSESVFSACFSSASVMCS